MKLFEINISAEQTKDMLKAYADSVTKTDFELMAPALEKYFPEARFKGTMYRAVDFDIDNSLPVLQKGKYSSWSKSHQGLEAVIKDMFSDWADTLAIYSQTGAGIDVNVVLDKHDHYNEEEIVAQTNNSVKLNSFWYKGESWPPDIDMLRNKVE